MKLRNCIAAASAALVMTGAQAQISGDIIRIGFITDMSSLYADIDGPGGAEAIRMAIQDFGGNVAGKKVELLYADHQNKPDVAATKAREWFDTQGLDMLVAGSNSATNLAMAKVAAEKKKPFFAIGGATSALTNAECTPYTLHWAYDTAALAKGTGSAVVKAGGKTWYFLTADYAFGHQLQADTTKVVTAAGGQVVGAVRHPLNASDFSSFLLQAQGSKAQILGLANAGGDTTNSIKAANEFGITKSMKLAGLLVFINDIHALGLNATQGMYLTDSWYVKAVGTDDTDKVMAQLRKMKFNDMFMKNGWVRGDGRVVHDMYLMQVKAPSDSKEPWDYYNVVSVMKDEEPWTTKADSKCALWK
jgi:branched-chain amino acid transport system substrate-binding protein